MRINAAKAKLKKTLEEHFILQDRVAAYQIEVAKRFLKIGQMTRQSEGTRQSIIATTPAFVDRYCATIFDSMRALPFGTRSASLQRKFSMPILPGIREHLKMCSPDFFARYEHTGPNRGFLFWNGCKTPGDNGNEAVVVRETYEKELDSVPYRADIPNKLSLSVANLGESQSTDVLLTIEQDEDGGYPSLLMSVNLISFLAVCDPDTMQPPEGSVNFPLVSLLRTLATDTNEILRTNTETVSELRNIDAKIAEHVRRDIGLLPDALVVDGRQGTSDSVAFGTQGRYGDLPESSTAVTIQSRPVSSESYRRDTTDEFSALVARRRGRNCTLRLPISVRDLETNAIRETIVEHNGQVQCPSLSVVNGVYKCSFTGERISPEPAERRRAYFWYWQRVAVVGDIEPFQHLNHYLEDELAVLERIIEFADAMLELIAPYGLAALV